MFTQPISMQCTQEQYKADLKLPLLEMGYKESNMGDLKNYPYLVNNIGDNLGDLSNVGENNKLNYNRYYIDHYNPQLFLALASMTDEKYGIKGEWWKCNQSYADVFTGAYTFTGGTLYKSQEGLDTPMAVFNNYDDPDGFYPENLDYFRKATKEELINYFTTKQETQMETTKTYSVTVSQMMDIEAIACNTWKPKIRKMIKYYLDEATGIVVLQEPIVEKMFEAATSDQKPILQSVFSLYGKEEDKNAFVKTFNTHSSYLSNFCEEAFNDTLTIQIGFGAVKDELGGRSLYVNSKYEVVLHESPYAGTTIEIKKK